MTAPSSAFSTLYFEGEAPAPGKELVVLFWAKFAKGDYKHVAHFNELTKIHEGIQLIGISCDSEEEDARAFVGKIGKEFAEQNIKSLDCDYGAPLPPHTHIDTRLFVLLCPATSCLHVSCMHNVYLQNSQLKLWLTMRARSLEHLSRISPNLT